MKNKTNLVLDIGVFAAFLIAMEPDLTGIAIHEWLSLGSSRNDHRPLAAALEVDHYYCSQVFQEPVPFIQVAVPGGCSLLCSIHNRNDERNFGLTQYFTFAQYSTGGKSQLENGSLPVCEYITGYACVPCWAALEMDTEYDKKVHCPAYFIFTYDQ